MKNKRLLSVLLKAALAVMLVAALAFLRVYLQEKDDAAEESSDVAYAEMVDDDHPLLRAFRERHPDREVILACAEDITDDGLTDLVVISQFGSEIETIALIDSADGTPWETEPIPAPREHQHIRFFDMDKADEIEVLITGEKDGEVGYAIYRIIDEKLFNLFGESMENCC